jgi:predicted Rossmann fold flavoprotein
MKWPKDISCDLLIIGAGASGLICAITAATRDKKVVIIDHSKAVGQKMLVSGGGRCNFTNLNISASNYFSSDDSFCTETLKKFPPEKIISFFRRQGVDYFEKEDGQLFCKGSARQVTVAFLKECRKQKVDIHLKTFPKKVTLRDEVFEVETDDGKFRSKKLVIATGGLSYPKLGATEFGYKIARQFGLKVTKLRPALTPLNLGKEFRRVFGNLSGVSTKVRLTVAGRMVTGEMLFTHTGLSGPAILNASLFWNEGEVIKIEFIADKKPQRLSRVLKGLGNLNEIEIVPESLAGFNVAEVTRGGVDPKELNKETLEAKEVPNLYFIGEVIDVTGFLGGYNLHWAWASGYSVGMVV